jgi:hypothetical protein
MSYGFQIYGDDGSLQFDHSSVALMLHDSFEVTGTSAYSKSYTWANDVNSAFLVIETSLDNTPDFMFNVFPNYGATVTKNTTTRTVTITGTPSYTNVGKSVGSWSTYVSNCKMKFLVYVE